MQAAAAFVSCRSCSASSPHKTTPAQGAPCWALCWTTSVWTTSAPSRSSSWPVRVPARECGGSQSWVGSGPDEPTRLVSSPQGDDARCTFRLVPDLATELEYLAEADKRIAEAHAAIADVENAIATNRHTGPDPAGLLQTMKGNLKAFEVHRALIVRNIEDIKTRKM